MSPPPGYEVLWTQTALEMLAGIGDRRIRQQLFDTSKRLEADPEKQGKPLREGLMGFRSLRVVGQRYRLVYSIVRGARLVYIVVAGLRREGSREDVYELAEKIVRLGLAPSARPRKATKRGASHLKKKKGGTPRAGPGVGSFWLARRRCEGAAYAGVLKSAE